MAHRRSACPWAAPRSPRSRPASGSPGAIITSDERASSLHLAPLAGTGRNSRIARISGERLSGESSCIGVLGSRIACFGVEADEQFARERNSDDHFFLSGGNQSGAELPEALVVAGGNGGDEEQDRTHAGTSATNRSLAFSLATIVGDRGDTDELGNGLVGIGADLR